MRRTWFVGAVMGAVVLAAAIWTATTLGSTSKRGSATGGTVTIGISLSLSGDFSDEGKAAKLGYQLWAKDVNKHGGLRGKKVSLKVVDDTSSPNQAVTNYESLISRNKVDFVFGPFSTLLTAPSARVAHRYGYAFIEPAGGGPAVFAEKLDNVFFAQPAPAVKNADVLAAYILSLPKSKRPKTAAYPMLDDPFAAPPIERLEKKLKAVGIKTVYKKTYPSEVTDWSPIVSKIVSAKPDLIAGGTQNVDGYGIAKDLKQDKYNPKYLYLENGPNNPATFPSQIGRNNTTGIMSSGDWFPAEKSYGNKQFIREYLRAYHGSANDIDTTSAEAYACGQILKEVTDKTKSLDNGKIIKALHKGVWPTVNGRLSWDKYGMPKGNTILVEWIGGKLMPVYPPKTALHKPIAKAKWH